MNHITEMLFNDRKLSLGVTEPGSLAYAAALAYRKIGGRFLRAETVMSSGIYKNAYSCGIPNTNKNGIELSVALGIVAGDPDLELMALSHVAHDDVINAEQLVKEGKIAVQISSISSEILVAVTVYTDLGKAAVVIEGTHTNIVRITVNDNVEFEKSGNSVTDVKTNKISQFSVSDLVDYAAQTPYEEISDLFHDYEVNLELSYSGIENPYCEITRQMILQNDGKVFSENELETAQVLTTAAIEARVSGMNYPAVSIAGSGSHGIMCTMPLYAVYQNRKNTDSGMKEKLCRATALSYLITMYIKEFSGRLSAFCGCGIAGGIGAACGIIFLKNGNFHQMLNAVANYASGITGMICDGGNKGCVIKAMTAVDAVWRAVALAMNGITISGEYGISDFTAEDIIRNIGKIADPGMQETENTILNILADKASRMK